MDNLFRANGPIYKYYIVFRNFRNDLAFLQVMIQVGLWDYFWGRDTIVSTFMADTKRYTVDTFLYLTFFVILAD